MKKGAIFGASATQKFQPWSQNFFYFPSRTSELLANKIKLIKHVLNIPQKRNPYQLSVTKKMDPNHFISELRIVQTA